MQMKRHKLNDLLLLILPQVFLGGVSVYHSVDFLSFCLYKDNIFVISMRIPIFTKFKYFHVTDFCLPNPVVAQSKAWIYGRSLDGIAGSNPARGMDVCLL
jgi:hypothetical protein